MKALPQPGFDTGTDRNAGTIPTTHQLPDGLTTRWHVDYAVTRDGNLERIDSEKTSAYYIIVNTYTPKTCFLTRFREHGDSST